MKYWAYLDAGSILHIVENSEDARKYALRNGKYISTDIKFSRGLPLVSMDGKDKELIVYNIGEAYIDGNAYNGKRVVLDIFTDVYKLYRELM